MSDDAVLKVVVSLLTSHVEMATAIDARFKRMSQHFHRVGGEVEEVSQQMVKLSQQVTELSKGFTLTSSEKH